MHIKVPRKRDFLSLFSNKTDFYKYLKCILIEFRCGFLGVPITFSKFAKALGVQGYETIPAGKAIAWCYGGLVLGYAS
jgi:hypothetical protein